MNPHLPSVLVVVAAACQSPEGDPGASSSSDEASESTIIDATGTSTGVDTTATEEESTATTDVPMCTDEQCLADDPTRPICGNDGMCVGCNGAGGDAACAGAHPDLPVCLIAGSGIGTCVECTQAASAECTGMTPVCDEATNTCVPCDAHAQCMDAVGSACHIETGECLPADRVWHVDGDADAGGDGSEKMPYQSIGAALMNVDAGEQGTIVLHEASSDYAAAVSIDGGRVVAIVAPGTDRPSIGAISVAGGLVVVSGLDTVAYLEGLTVTLNGLGPGLRVDDEARARVDRCELVENDVGIEVANGAALVLRNSIAWTDVDGEDAVSLSGATADINYTTLAHLAGLGTTHALDCSDAMGTIVRNSVIVARPLNENGWNCGDATISNSAGENIPFGNGNLILCDPEELDCSMDVILSLFASPTDLRLSSAGANILADIPEPTPDDPPYDIDLNPRPSLSGTDYAGAHAPP